jgi:hypothetical protein
MLKRFTKNSVCQRKTLKFYGKLQKSHVFGDTSVPLIEQTLGSYFEQKSLEFSQQEALVSRHQNLRYTWEELNVKIFKN